MGVSGGWLSCSIRGRYHHWQAWRQWSHQYWLLKHSSEGKALVCRLDQWNCLAPTFPLPFVQYLVQSDGEEIHQEIECNFKSKLPYQSEWCRSKFILSLWFIMRVTIYITVRLFVLFILMDPDIGMARAWHVSPATDRHVRHWHHICLTSGKQDVTSWA